MWEYTFWKLNRSSFCFATDCSSTKDGWKGQLFLTELKVHFFSAVSSKKKKSSVPVQWHCIFWPAVFSELWLWSFSLFSFARAHPTQYQLARVTKWNILKSKGFIFILMIFASKIKMIKGALEKNAKSHYSKKSNCEFLKMAGKSDGERDFAGHGMHGSNSHGRRKYWISGWIVAPHPRESP